jgi:hypothetical protein
MDADPDLLNEETCPTGESPWTGSSRKPGVPGLSRRGRYRLSTPWRPLMERRWWITVVGACFAVAILLLSSSVPVSPNSSNSHAQIAGSSNPPTPQSPFLPYVINASQYPLPDTLLNATANISHPHVTEVSYLNQTIFEVTYLQTDPSGNTTLEYLYGRYSPTLAVCILNASGCPAQNRSNLPIEWTAENPIYSLGSALGQDTAIGSFGSLSAVAVSSRNQTHLLYTYDFGQFKTWNNPTPVAVPGATPRIVVSASTIVLTTISTSHLIVTTFHLPVQNPLTPAQTGGGGTRGPLSPTPTVISVSPYYGSPGTVTNVYGTNFFAPATVYIGTHGVRATVLSSTHIQAAVPNFPSTTPLNVSVQTTYGTSPVNWPADLFEITTPGALPTPLIFSVVPSTALPNTTVNITGFGFVPSMQLWFGGSPASRFTVTGDNFVTATVPWGTGGPVDVTVISLGIPSMPGPTDRFTFAVSQSALPMAISASPVLLNRQTPSSPQTIGVVATNASSSTVVFYNSTNGGTSYSMSKTSGVFSVSTGSAIFSALGSSRIFVAGGYPGQEATVGFGNTIFALFTTNVENRTVVETEGSSDGGHTWTGPYASAPLIGTVLDPYATISPEGYVYVTWLENGAGPWQVDQVVYTESGRLLAGPQVLPDSGGPAGSSAFSPSVTVDGLARPLYVWGWYNASVGGGVLRATGAFLSAANVTTDLTAAFHQTVPSDYIASDSLEPGWHTNWSNFMATVNTSLALVQGDISGAKAPCTTQSDAITSLFPKLTTAVPKSVVYGEANGCSIRFGASTTQISNNSGPLEADMYLGVYGEWLAEAVGYGKLTEPYWVGAPSQDSLYTGFYVPRPPLYLPPDQPANASGTYYHVSVNPLTVNPNAILLNVTGWFDSKYSNGHNICGYDPTRRGSISDSDVALYANETVTINSGAGGTFHPSGWIPSVFVTNLSANTTGTYSVQVSVTYQQTETAYDGCDNSSQYNYQDKVVSTFSGWPTSFTVTLTGSFTTYLEAVPEGLVVHEVGNASGSQARDYIAWNNSMLATQTTAVTGSSYSNSSGLGNATFQLPENTGQFFVPLQHWYNATTTLTSETGGYDAKNWSILLNSNLNGGHQSTPEAYTVGCAFYEAPNPVGITWRTANNVTNVTTSGATLTWYSNVSGTGWAHYNDSEEGVYTATATLFNESGHPEVAGYPYRYTVELHGLSPWAWYRVTVGVSSYSGCLEYDNGAVWYIHVLSLVTLSEFDFAYDSITQQGGGAQLSWSIPSAFAAEAKYDSGYLAYCQWDSSTYPAQCDANTSVDLPLDTPGTILSGSQFTYYAVNSTFTVNTTSLTRNATYNATVFLNFTLGGRLFNASSRPTYFTYEHDTTGDGLTDWEKLRGWEVTTQHADGYWYSSWVTANPSLWATNGLTSDYIEKLYGLNPNTVDSAGSHMLDTWNLTFDLGPKGSALTVPYGANFQYWYEAGNSSGDYKWTTACQYDPGPGASCTKGSIGTDWTNITGADGWAWASRVLWSRSALETFVNLSGVQHSDWLRATFGNTSTDWTLTVWGKLSWGANPLATSTPGDGIADGSRVNPLYDEQLVIGNLWSNLTACPIPPSGGAYGWAVLFYLNWSTATGPHELPAGGNYSTAALDDGSGTYGCGTGISNYRVPIPINGTSQNQSLQVRILLNLSSSPSQTNLKAQKFVSGSGTKASISYDTVAGRVRKLSYTGTNATLSFTLSVVPSGVKTNTLLWLPTDNSSLNNLPWGLKRYTGEQAFDLIVVNQTTSSTLTSDYLPYAQNSSAQYQLNLTPGLNNILIPRGQFLYSVLGQAILLGKDTAWLNASALPPLLGSAENSTINYGSSNPLMNLACYWQNRAINNTTGSVTPICMHNSTNGLTSETGTHLGSQYGIVVVADTSASGIDAGGVPGNPTLENGSEAGAALQSVLTLNISAQAGFDLFLAALLDNTTGGVNGTFLPVTYEVPPLGLNPVVARELANATQASSGLFGVPWGKVPPPPPPPPCNSLWCYGSNLVSGIVSVGSQFFSFVWGEATAVAQYINDHIPTWLKNLGAQFVARTAGALAVIGQVLASALSLFLRALEALLLTLLSPVINPIKQAISARMTAISAAANQTESDIVQFGSVASSDAFALAHSLDPLAVAAVVIDVGIAVALTILKAASIGGDFLLGTLVTLFFALVLLAPVALITSLTASAITWLQTNYPNGLPSNDWKAIAGVVGVVGSSGDFLMWIIAGAAKAASISSYAGVVVAMSMDLIVLFMSVLAWAAANPLIAIMALAMASLAFFITLASQKSFAGVLSPYGKFSLVLSAVGMGTAAADVAAA